MPYKDLEVRRAYMQRYAREVLGKKPRNPKPSAEELKERARLRASEWRKNNLVRAKENRKPYDDKQRIHHLEWRHKLRRDVIKKYGEVCACCGEAEFWFLDIEHINGSGIKQRSQFRDYVSFLRWLIAGHRDDIRVLCHNCNKARLYGDCPHDNGVALAEGNSAYVTEEKLALISSARKRADIRWRHRARRKVIEMYGGICACCAESEFAFLAIDHIDGGGTKHIRSFGTYSGYMRWLLAEKRGGFRILCHNCNRARARCGGQCPHGVSV